ncbi:hypothetical protein ACIQ2D_19730 [Lysinibacillus sp. NPDC097287]|uniref:hypothetical protein n=1 Tax=Lysinibacillus sp. NPDC097287 TaxID=3364144 RepID=UPI0038155B6D
MEDQERQLFDALKNRSGKEPNLEFSKQVRRKLQTTHAPKRKRFSVVTVLTIPVTFAIVAFLVMIVTGQSLEFLELKSAAQHTIPKEKNLPSIVVFCLLLALLLYIVFVYSKGYLKGQLVYMTFSLSFVAWVGNVVYAESIRIEEPSSMPTNSESYENEISPYLIQKEHDQPWDVKLEENSVMERKLSKLLGSDSLQLKESE